MLPPYSVVIVEQEARKVDRINGDYHAEDGNWLEQVDHPKTIFASHPDKGSYGEHLNAKEEGRLDDNSEFDSFEAERGNHAE